jgi:AraC-like DNA-binding protein
MIRDIRSYLTAHYNEKITLERLAARFNLDPYYLQKLFKRHIGQSPLEYIIYLRMTRARSLLRTSAMSISEVAYTVGIDNISHFARQFKKLEGVSPGQYRKFWSTD